MNRRQVLTSGGLGLAATIAGCLDAPDLMGSSDPTASAAFFSLKDWTNQIGGSAIDVTTPVEVGEMGHGWDPDADIVPDIAQHDLFIHLGTPEFQWAIDVSRELENEESTDIHVVDGLEAISTEAFLPFTGRDEVLREPDEEVDGATAEIGEFEVIYGEEVVAWWHDGHWHGGVPDVPHGETRHLGFNVVTTDDAVVPLDEEGPFAIDAAPTDGAPNDVVDIRRDDASLVIEGVDVGQTTIAFSVTYDGDSIFDTQADPMVVTVVEDGGTAIDAFYDPHVWVDPVHAEAMVEYFAETFGTIYPDEADTFQSNADDYIERIRGVDEEFQELVEDADLDVAVAVAHNAFQYLEVRYGFDLRTPVGVTPDAAESIEDIARLAETVDRYDIETILYDPFESPNPGEELPQAATLLLDETGASDAAPLTAAEGITPEWREQGYGWVEQMQDINVPSLRRALRADP